ncbi:MAG: hypothetical protein WCF82_16555 [Microcoleus sp.]
MDSPLDQFDKTDMVLNPITVGLAVLERWSRADPATNADPADSLCNLIG